MLVHLGVYHFWPKPVGFRNDYCLSCEGPRRAVAVRTFDVGHIYWIPILPAGFWKHWKCTVCGSEPHVNVKTRRSFKWAGLGCLTIVSVPFWMDSAEVDPLVNWALRIVPLVLAVLLLQHLLRTSAEPSLKERLRMIQPATDSFCPFCATPLLPDTNGKWSCPACGAVRR